MRNIFFVIAVSVMLILSSCSDRSDKLTALIPENPAYIAKIDVSGIAQKCGLTSEEGNFAITDELNGILSENEKSFVSRVLRTLPSSGLRFTGDAYLFGGSQDFLTEFIIETDDADATRNWLCRLTNESAMKCENGIDYIFDDDVLYALHNDVLIVGVAAGRNDAGKLTASLKAAFEGKGKNVSSNATIMNALDKDADVELYMAVSALKGGNSARRMKSVAIAGMPISDIIAGLDMKAVSATVNFDKTADLEAEVTADATSAYKMMFGSVVSKPSAEFLQLIPSSMETVISLSVKGGSLLNIPALGNLLVMAKTMPIIRDFDFKKIISTIDGPVAVGISRDANFIDEYNVVVAVASIDTDALISELDRVAAKYGKQPQHIDGEKVYEYFNQRITVGVKNRRYVYFKLNNYQNDTEFMNGDAGAVELFGKSPIGVGLHLDGYNALIGFSSADKFSCHFGTDSQDSNVLLSIIRLMCKAKPLRDFSGYSDDDDSDDDFGAAMPIDGFTEF